MMGVCRKSAILVFAVLCLTSYLTAQKSVNEMTQPLTLAGQVSAGVSNFQEDGESSTSAVSSINADLSGYWKTPRLLMFDVAPTVTFGSTQGISGIGGPFNGFSSSATLLAGSAIPFTVSYSRFHSGSSNQIPGSVLSESSSTASSLGLDWQINLRRLPGIRINYTKTDSDSEFTGLDNHGFQTNSKVFSLDSTYQFAGWDFGGGYRSGQSDRTSPDLFDVSGNPLVTDQNQDNFNLNARKSITESTQFSAYLNHLESDYTYRLDESKSNSTSAHAVFTARPTSKLSTSLDGQFLQNSQTTIQYVETTPGNPNPTVTTAGAEAKAVNLGGGAGYAVGHGVNLHGALGAGKSLVSTLGGESLPWNFWWSSGIDYGHQIHHTGYFGVGYTYQETLLSVVAGPRTNASSHNLSGNIGGPLGMGLMASASGQYSEICGDEGQGRSYSGTLNLSHDLGRIWKLSADVTYGRSQIDFLSRFRSSGTSFGLSLTSRQIQLTGRRQHSSGTVFQFAGPLLLDETTSAETPFAGSGLATNNTEWTSLAAMYRPNRPLLLGFSLGKYDFSGTDPGVSALVRDTGSWYLNANAGYRLRRLQFVFGYTQTSQLAGNVLARDFGRRTLYFQIIREFKVF